MYYVQVYRVQFSYIVQVEQMRIPLSMYKLLTLTKKSNTAMFQQFVNKLSVFVANTRVLLRNI